MTRPAPLSPECRLVFLTAGGHRNDAAVAALAAGPIDWGRALVIAEREHAVPSLGRALQAIAPGAVPAEVLTHLRKRRMVSDFRMLHLEQRLQATLKTLRDSNVDVLLLKGAAFGATMYPSFAERPMIDVDLLVRRDDVTTARNAIMASGWKASADPVLADLLSHHHHLPAFDDSSETGLKLELHTSLLPPGHPFALKESDIWNASVEADARFHGARVPAPRHLLYHACVHFAWSHAMEAGAWRTFRDTSELLTVTQFDWDQFVEIAQRSRAASACYWMLRLAQRVSGLDIPATVLARLRSPSPEFALRALERHFVATIAPGEGPPCPSTTFAKLCWRVAIRPSWSGHGKSAPWIGKRDWDLERFGVRPRPLGTRAMRHVAGMQHWWKYVVRTLAPLT